MLRRDKIYNATPTRGTSLSASPRWTAGASSRRVSAQLALWYWLPVRPMGHLSSYSGGYFQSRSPNRRCTSDGGHFFRGSNRLENRPAHTMNPMRAISPRITTTASIAYPPPPVTERVAL